MHKPYLCCCLRIIIIDVNYPSNTYILVDDQPKIPIPSGVRVWVATGHTDMRRGMNSLALQVQERLKRDPHAGDLYV